MALVLLAILALLAVLIARADASPIAPAGEAEPIDDADEMADTAAVAEDIALEPPVAVAAATLGAQPVPRVPADDLQRVAAAAPKSSTVVAAAYRAAGLATDPTASWRRRARLAGLVPTLTVRDGQDAAWRDVSDPTIAYVSVFSVAATWHLERMMFDPNELRISAIEAGRRRDRRRVAALAIRTYFAWLHLRAAAEREPRWTLRADEAAAELDALTDGWFTDVVTRAPPRPTPSAATRNLPPTPSADQAVEK